MDGTARLAAHGETVALGRNYRIRRLDVVPGAEGEYRLHRHRTEQYVVLAGQARITRGDDVIQAGPNASVFVPFGVPHRIENAGRGVLSVLEVQVGAHFDEDDRQNA
jgi:mannose-6-phosphate isomerase-like protein (cupin superfamily)